MTSSPADEATVSQLVVIGASAGGVDALRTLIAGLPADFPSPVVIAQHIEPHRPSQLGDVLAKHSALPVRTIEGDVPLKPGVVYIVPAGYDVEITDHHVAVDLQTVGRAKPSIDRLLTTAAHLFGEGLISVILTGMGVDGAAGAQATQAYGGTVIVQNPETARFPDLPRAVPITAVDVVADLDAIAPLLTDLLRGTYGSMPVDDEEEAILRAFLERVREQTGLDFGAYKRATIQRRLQRRMAAVGVQTLADYRRYTERHPDELRQLSAHFLIKVTEFFRDPDLFAHVRNVVLPPLIANARERGELRLWSAGCATGEEAYSLAIVVADLIGEEADGLAVRIFATDVAVEALDVARRGIYPEVALKGLPEELVERHFTLIDGVYQVKRPIREMVIFGEHDLGHRAPFPRIDLVLCRNVMIYFTTDLQRRALQHFAASLRPGGYLVLGKSETVSPLPEFFALEQPRLKVYRRVGASAPILTDDQFNTLAFHPDRRNIPRRLASEFVKASPVSADATTPVAAVPASGLSVGVITVVRQYNIATINAAARSLLGLHGVSAGADLIHALATDLAAPLRRAIDAAWGGEEIIATYSAPSDIIDTNKRDLFVRCAPVSAPEAEVQTVLIEAADVTPIMTERRELAIELERVRAERDELRGQIAAAAPEIRTLRQATERLVAELEYLRSANEQLQIGNEEAQAATEEVETLNEELQATNEELETLNEEMQATVEELRTTNDELHARTAELEQSSMLLEHQRQTGEAARARLEAILTHMGDAVLVVDTNGEVILTNTAYQHLFGDSTDFVPEDEAGRQLPEDTWPQRRAARGESFTLAFTLPGPDGTRRWFESNAQPVPGGSGAQWGVLVIRDITERSLLQQQDQSLAMAAEELRALSRRLLRVQEEERRNLARELHDEIGQMLTGLNFQLASAAAATPSPALQEAQLTVQALTEQVRQLSMNLRPAELDRYGLLAALEWHVARYQQQTGITVHLHHEGLDQRFSPEVEIAAYRVVQEALTNVARHAATDAATVRVLAAQGILTIVIRDSGLGFDLAQASENTGLGGMRERVNLLGGSVEIESAPGSGVVITAEIPIEAEVVAESPDAHQVTDEA